MTTPTPHYDHAPHLEPVVLPVDYDGCDVLVHEEQDGGQDGREYGRPGGPGREAVA